MVRPVIDTREGRAVIQRTVREETALVVTAKTVAVERTTDEVKAEIRARVIRAFSGRGVRRFGDGPANPQRLANTVRSRIYGRRSKTSAAGWIYSLFGRTEDGEYREFFFPFVRGSILTPRRAKFLYIPIEKGQLARRRRRLAASLDENVVFIPSKDRKRIWLVRRQGKQTKLIAVLVKQVKMPRLITFENLGSAQRLEANLAAALQ